MLKPFSQSVNTEVDSINSESLSPLRPFSEGISIYTEYAEALAIIQPGTTIEDYRFSKLSKLPWWKAARKLQKKGAPWKHILAAVEFSYAGERPDAKIGKNETYWMKLLQIGWPDEHGKPTKEFRYAKGDKDMIMPSPEGSINTSFDARIKRLLKTWGKKITEGDIAAALEIYAHGGKLTKDQQTILQAGWFEWFGPNGVPFKKYDPDADKIKNMFPAGTAPDYDTIKKLQARGFFDTTDRTKRNKILAELKTYVKGYQIAISKDTQKLLKSKYYFSDSQIRALVKLGKSKPSSGYTRYVNLDAIPKTKSPAFDRWHREAVRVIGFIDMNPEKEAEEIFYKGELTPGGIPEMTPEKVPEDVPEEKKPSWIEKLRGKPVPKEKKKPKEVPKFSQQLKYKMNELSGKITKRQRAKITVLKARGTEPGYKRYTYDKVPFGSDDWIMAYLFDFVDIDKEGEMHPAFVPGRSAELTRYYEAGMNFHRDVGYY